ncbi:hypothetical protein [Arthrobacter cryoconiti]|uniref:Uncharacterized protein n=1 Tax=Arthrobacter cryoconiti TaxID=748907 RepID=A0ABV8QYS3_9MICC|nr:hypothetical protein [Arthrobacter cryoconiti]MCC9069537.1 hypothetical protein [Arthrobacter cryoconiti]
MTRSGVSGQLGRPMTELEPDRSIDYAAALTTLKTLYARLNTALNRS